MRFSEREIVELTQLKDVLILLSNAAPLNKAIYEMFPIEWMNDNDWKVALEKFPSFLGVITYLTEVNAVKLMVLLKEEITEYYSKEGI